MTFEELKDEIRKLAGAEKLTNDTSFEEIDSLGLTEIVSLADEYFGIEISYPEIDAMKTFGELESLLHDRGLRA